MVQRNDEIIILNKQEILNRVDEVTLGRDNDRVQINLTDDQIKVIVTEINNSLEGEFFEPFWSQFAELIDDVVIDELTKLGKIKPINSEVS